MALFFAKEWRLDARENGGARNATFFFLIKAVIKQEKKSSKKLNFFGTIIPLYLKGIGSKIDPIIYTSWIAQSSLNTPIVAFAPYPSFIHSWMLPSS